MMKDQNMPCGHKWSDYVSCAIGDEVYMCGKCSPIGMRVAQLEAEVKATNAALEINDNHISGVEDALEKCEAENDRLRFRECPVCGRRIVVLHELAAHMKGNEPCPGSCSLVRVDS